MKRRAKFTDVAAHSYRQLLFKWHTKHASELVAVSDSTAKELADTIHLNSTIIYNVCDSFIELNKDTAPATENAAFFLHRGHWGAHKNTRRVVEAFARVRQAHPEVMLLVYGVGPEDVRLRGLPTDGVQLLGKISDTRLASLCKSAVAVLVPSIVEGFGLAIIESFGFGTAVLTSNIPPMSDIAGEAAVTVDPTDVGQIAEAMGRLLVDIEFRQDVSRKGAERYRHYSAHNVAARLAVVYRRALVNTRFGSKPTQRGS